MKILAIDPGHKGAFVLYNKSIFKWWAMPIQTDGKNVSVEFSGIVKLLNLIKRAYPDTHIYLERAKPLAMGSKHAFNYGRDFAALEIAIVLSKIPVTYVEPSTWAKKMHEGVSKDLKTKAKSLVAVKRLLPSLVGKLPVAPKTKVPLDGPVDALLIAAYGLSVNTANKVEPSLDFY